MQLIDGSRSNGTYGATIPSQTKNTTVYYVPYFKDDLKLQQPIQTFSRVFRMLQL